MCVFSHAQVYADCNPSLRPSLQPSGWHVITRAWMKKVPCIGPVDHIRDRQVCRTCRMVISDRSYS
jgi:hypothetical protein